MELVVFFNETATAEIYTLSLHDALPIYRGDERRVEVLVGGLLADDVVVAQRERDLLDRLVDRRHQHGRGDDHRDERSRSEEHTSELQSRQYLVCRLLLEKNKPDHLPTSE